MDYIFKNGLTLCLLIYFLKFSSVFCDSVSFKKYSYNDNNYGKCLIPSSTAFEAEVQDPVTCGTMCHINSACESFYYQPDTHQCVGCRYKRYDAPHHNLYEKQDGSMYFSPVENFPSDCKDILRNYPNAKTGVHKIKLWKSKKTLEVFCDMDTAGGGWTVFQTRRRGTVDFNENALHYEFGFGLTHYEFWLGLKYIKEIADQSATEIRLDFSDGFGEDGYEVFQGFHLTGEEYTLNIQEESRRFSGGKEQFKEASTGFAGNNGNNFVARHPDRDMYPQYFRPCPENEKSAWWYDLQKCSGVDLNGPYLTPGTPWNESTGHGTPGFKHFGFAGVYSLKASKMMIRRN